MVPDFLHGAPTTDACAAFIKESRMKFVNAREFHRKSGCTLGRKWGTRPQPKTLVKDFNPQRGKASFLLLAQQDRGINRQRPPGRDAAREQSQQQHGQDDSGEHRRISRRGLIDN
jgi:hypothetical protein